MGEHDRIRRPALERARPIRGWATLLGASDHVEPAAPRASAEPPPKDPDPVARSVELGYRVVDEYIRRGQDAAQRMRAGTYGPSAFVRDTRDLAERMVRSASDAIGAWAELIDLTSQDGSRAGEANGVAAASAERGTGDRAGQRVGDDGPASGNGTAAAVVGAPVRVRVCVDCNRSVEVVLDLDAALAEQEPVLHALRPTGGGDARLDDVSYAVDGDGMPTITLRIGAEHPSGVYRGLVVDARLGHALGSLSVSIRDR